MRKKKPHIASIEEVMISRDGQDAIIVYKDTTISTTHLTLGPEIDHMSDQDILDAHNQIISAMELMAASYEHIAVEIPPGHPQIKYDKECNQWVPRGQVLRCFIDEEDTISVDDQELALVEFGRMLATYAGWGMRIAFVPEDEVDEIPRIEVRHPDEE